MAPGRASDFTAMWRQNAPRVMAYALRHVDSDDAEEVVAETFLVAWRRLDDLPAQPLPWLLVVARNTIRNQRRSAHRRTALQEQMARLERLAEPAPAAEVSALHRVDVLRALSVLTAAEREALLLVAWDGLSPAEAARVAGCSIPTFHVRLYRARRRLCTHRHEDAEPARTAASPAPMRSSV